MKVKMKHEEFAEPKVKILTCGKDGKIKVWDFTRFINLISLVDFQSAAPEYHKAHNKL